MSNKSCHERNRLDRSRRQDENNRNFPSVSCGPRELNLPVLHSIPVDGLKHAVMFKCNDSRPCIQDESELPYPDYRAVKEAKSLVNICSDIQYVSKDSRKHSSKPTDPSESFKSKNFVPSEADFVMVN